MGYVFAIVAQQRPFRPARRRRRRSVFHRPFVSIGAECSLLQPAATEDEEEEEGATVTAWRAPSSALHRRVGEGGAFEAYCLLQATAIFINTFTRFPFRESLFSLSPDRVIAPIPADVKVGKEHHVGFWQRKPPIFFCWRTYSFSSFSFLLLKTLL